MASKYYDNLGKEVNDGDIIYAEDLNDVNLAIDTAFQQVEADIDTVVANQTFYTGLSQKWAESPEDVEVVVGSYSALHWAAKADADATSAAGAVATTTTNANTSITQAGIATTQAGTATTQAGIATTQAGIATTKAGEASGSAAAALTSENNAETAALEAASYVNGKIDYVVDGDFNSWLEGTSHSLTGYGSATMWGIAKTTSTITLSRQPFTLGQVDVPGEPLYFCRSTVVSGGGTAFARCSHNIESVRTLADKVATLSFYAKADSVKLLGLRLIQYAGSTGIGNSWFGDTIFNLTSVWQKFTLTLNVPSIAGKTIAGGDDSLGLQFWFDGTSGGAGAPEGLVAQSGTFDIARVRLVEGSIDGDHIQHTLAEDTLKVGRYYQQGTGSMFSSNVTSGATYFISTPYQTLMRAAPVITLTNAVNSSFSSTPGTTTALGSGYVESRVASATAAGYFRSTYKLDARL